MELTNEDIDVLVEALSTWEAKDFGSELMFGLLGSMFVDKKDEVQKAKWEEDERKRKEEAERLSKLRKEQSVLLKAKLISLKQNRAIDQLNKV